MKEAVLYAFQRVDLGGGGGRNKTEVGCLSINVYCKAQLITMSYNHHIIQFKTNKQNKDLDLILGHMDVDLIPQPHLDLDLNCRSRSNFLPTFRSQYKLQI